MLRHRTAPFGRCPAAASSLLSATMPDPAPQPAPEQVLAAARALLARPLDFDAFLARLPAKDRTTALRRVAAFEAEPPSGRADLWRRLACALMTLAPHAAKLVGRQTVQFYVADGRYRKQVFALEDLQDGPMTVYCPDALGEAVAAGLLARGAAHAGGGPHQWVIPASGEALQVEPLTGESLNPHPHFKDLTGWNRKALRVTLPPAPSPAQTEAAELLCAIAALRFVHPAVAGGPPTAAAGP